MIDQIVATMLMIAATMTGYAPLDPADVIVQEVSLEDLRIYVTGDPNSETVIWGSVSGSEIIYIRDDLAEKDDLLLRTVILHESVHLLQNAAGREFRCLGESEAEAYKVHLDWLETQGLTRSEAHALMGTTDLFVFIVTLCPQDWGLNGGWKIH